MKTINPQQLHGDPFTMISKEWMLITAKNKDTTNTMTASWGAMGVIWNKNVAFIFVRPKRYTKRFIDASQYVSLTFFDEKYRQALAYLGKVSGKDEDKITKSGLHLIEIEEVPSFAEANTTIIAKKLYAQNLTPESFLDKNIIFENYPLKDYHTMYVLEIEKILLK